MTKQAATIHSTRERNVRRTKFRAGVLVLTVLASTFTLPMSAAQALPGCKYCCIVICV